MLGQSRGAVLARLLGYTGAGKAQFREVEELVEDERLKDSR